jgi:hypothetical protein
MMAGSDLVLAEHGIEAGREGSDLEQVAVPDLSVVLVISEPVPGLRWPRPADERPALSAWASIASEFPTGFSSSKRKRGCRDE